MASSTITCLTWVQRGIAKETPDKVELSQTEIKKLFNEAKDGLQDGNHDEDGGDDAGTDDVIAESDGVTADNEDDLAKYGLDKYDEEDNNEPMEESEETSQGGAPASTLPSLAMYASNADDPYVTLKDDEDDDQFEKEDFSIRPTDNLLVVGKVHEDYANLEIHVYNEEEGALYVHHDILLPAFPLALEWLNFDPGDESPGNLVAVGSMLPVIDVWDLDVVDCLEPAFSLGFTKRQIQKQKLSGYQGHSDAVLDLSWNHSVSHILASASADHTIALWDLDEGKAVSSIRKHIDKVQSIQWHPFEAQSLLSGGFDKTVKVYDCRNPDDNLQSWTLDGEVERVLWNHFQPFTFLASTDSGFVYCYDVRTAKDPLFRLKAHDDAVSGLALSNQVAGCLVTASADQTYKVWDIQNNKPSLIVSKDPKMKAIHCIQSSPDSAFVIALGGERDGLRTADILSHAPVAKQFGDRPKLTIPKPVAVPQSNQLLQGQPGTSSSKGVKDVEDESDASSIASTSAPKSRRRKKKKKNVKN